MLFLLFNKAIPIISAINSANGTVSHTPFNPIIIGRIYIPINININPLLAEIIIDALAFPIAVKKPEFIILNPHNRKEKA